MSEKGDTKSNDRNVPQSIGVIMDGNRRWAAAQDQPSVFGHARGREVFGDCVEWIREAGVRHAVFYSLSTENWKRSEEEVAGLMDLFRSGLEEVISKAGERKVRGRIIGQRDAFPEDIQKLMDEAEAATAKYASEDTGTTIWLAMSYGGRAEIVEAVNAAIAAGESVDEGSFEKQLWSAGLPDLDLIIRTGGHNRLSNFMLWHAAYAELVTLEKNWPDFTKADFDTILEYARTGVKQNFGA